MRNRIHIGYKLHKKKKTKRLIKHGELLVTMETDRFNPHTGEKLGTQLVRLNMPDAIRTRELLASQLEDITELIADMEAVLAD